VYGTELFLYEPQNCAKGCLYEPKTQSLTCIFRFTANEQFRLRN